MDYAEAIWTLICFAVGIVAGERYAKGKVTQLKAENGRLKLVIDRIKERAERVSEGEDWDLGEYCVRIIEDASGGDQ